MRKETVQIRVYDDATRDTVAMFDVPTLREKDNGIRFIVSMDCESIYQHPSSESHPIYCSAEYLVPLDIAEFVGIETLPCCNVQHQRISPGNSLTLFMTVGAVAFSCAGKDEVRS